MNRSFLTTNSPVKFIKYAVIATLSLSTLCVAADEYNYPIDLDESSPYTFTANLDKTIDINLKKQFTTIESVCLEGIAESGRPGTVVLSEMTVPFENGLSYTLQKAKAFTYRFYISLPGEPVPPAPRLENFTVCFDVPDNFNDGIATFDLTFTGDDLVVTSLNLVINGESNNTEISSAIADESSAIIPANGGPLIFNTEVTNLDIDFDSKKFRSWAHITFPNGDIYPVKAPRKLNIQYQETKNIDMKFFVPKWFDTGEYALTVYVADKLNGERVTSSFNFTKLSDAEETEQ